VFRLVPFADGLLLAPGNLAVSITIDGRLPEFPPAHASRPAFVDDGPASMRPGGRMPVTKARSGFGSPRPLPNSAGLISASQTIRSRHSLPFPVISPA